MAQSYIDRFNKLKTQRANFEKNWQSISDYVLPNRGDFSIQRSPGERKELDIFDSTAGQSLEMLASSLHGGITNPTARWFELKARPDELNKVDAVTRWAKEVTNVLYAVFNSPYSNFSSQNHEMFLSLGSYGTSCMYIDEEIGVGINFQTIHMSQIYLLENARGMVDTVFRKFKYTARQAYERWGQDCGDKVLQCLEHGDPDKDFEFLHIVYPQGDKSFEPKPLGKQFPFASCYISLEDKKILSEKGYRSMPYLTPRWVKSINEVYGWSPALMCLSDIRMINKMAETTIKSAQKIVDPPLLLADDGVILPVRIQPGGLNFGGVSPDGRPTIQPLQTGGNLPLGMDLMDRVRQQIRSAFFIDQMLLPQSPSMTATEVMQRNDERLRMMGPMLGRIQTEYLGPLIERVYSILEDTPGQLPPLPEELEGRKIDIEYVGPLAKAQRGSEALTMIRTLESMGPLIQFKPDLLDNIETDGLFRHNATLLGVPIEGLRSQEEVDAIRQNRAQQEQAQAQMQMVSQGASQAAELNKAGIDIGLPQRQQ